MDTVAIAGMSVNASAAKLQATVQTATQRSAMDAVQTQASQLLQSIEIPADLTYSPDGPSAGTKRTFIADL